MLESPDVATKIALSMKLMGVISPNIVSVGELLALEKPRVAIFVEFSLIRWVGHVLLSKMLSEAIATILGRFRAFILFLCSGNHSPKSTVFHFESPRKVVPRISQSRGHDIMHKLMTSSYIFLSSIPLSSVFYPPPST